MPKINSVGAGVLDYATLQKVKRVEGRLYRRVFFLCLPSLHKIQNKNNFAVNKNFYSKGIICFNIRPSFLLGFFILTFLLISNSYAQEGRASWYGNESICWQWGGHTRNGEMFDENKLTCAMPKKSQINKWYKVTNLSNERSVIVWANDTGSFAKYNRVIDLSRKAFASLDNLDKGIIKVKVEEIKK